MQVEDIFNLYKHKFSSASVAAMNAATSQHLIYQYNVFEGWSKGYVNSSLPTWIYADASGKQEESMHLRLQDVLFKVLDISPIYRREIALVRFFGVHIKDETKREASINKLVCTIEDLVNKDYVLGHLSKMIEMSMIDDSKVICSYLIISDAGSKYLDTVKLDIEIREGEMPKSLED
jgi:hypothetical protein